MAAASGAGEKLADNWLSYPELCRSRAREIKPPYFESVEERVQYIADLMSDNVWNAHSTRVLQKACAEAWKLESLSTVRKYSAEAGRLVEDQNAEQRAAVAARAFDRLEQLAEPPDADCRLPGVHAAAVRANEVILKATGFAEPEADKNRPSTLIQVGQVVTSPVFAGLLNGSRQLNGPTNGSDPEATEAAEGAEAVPGEDPDE